MVDITLLLAFLIAAGILTVTPGVDTAMVLRSATLDGRRTAVFASLGIVTGCLIWGAIVSLGLGILLKSSELAYAALKFAGAFYLVWLGIKLLRTKRIDEVARESSDRPSAKTAFLRGFLTNMLNPKIGVFYVTFLPQFVPAGVSVASYSFFLAVLHVFVTLIWFAGLIAAAVPLGAFLRRPATARTLDRITGGIFIAFGVKLATSSNR